MSEESHAGDKALFLVLGAMIGAAAALLLAPRSGEETRKLLASKARESADLLAEQRQTVVGKTTEYVDRGKDIIQQQRDSLTAAIDAGKQAYKEEKDKA